MDLTETPASISTRSPLTFVVLLLGLAIPIWGISRFVGVIESLKIPITDLMLGFTPLAASAMLILRNEAPRDLARFLKSFFNFRALVRSGWMPATLLLAPLIYLLTWSCLHLIGHRGATGISWSRLPFIAAIMFLLAIGEEGGWTGYLLDPLQCRFGAVGASLIIAVPWWVGHIPSILEIGGGVADLAWWIPGAIGLRILMTWLYNNSGRSVTAPVLFHTSLNVGRSMCYPTVGTHYDPVYQATGYTVASILAIAVVAIWGPRTLTKPFPKDDVSI